MGKKSPAFQLYAADFYMDVIGWTNEEVGAYFRLLMYSWINGPLPNDTKELSSIAQCGVKKFAHNWKKLQTKFTSAPGDKLINKRLEETRKEQANYRKSLSEAGKRGAKERWKDHGDPNGHPNEVAYGQSMPLQPSSSPSVELDTNVSNTVKVSKKTTSQCPHEKIIDLYHKTLPMCPQVRTWPDHLKSILRSRWKTKNQDSIEFWEKFFIYVSHSKWLTGQVKDWCAGLEWLIRPTNFTKISNGMYHLNMNKTYKSMEGWIDAQQ